MVNKMKTLEQQKRDTNRVQIRIIESLMCLDDALNSIKDTPVENITEDLLEIYSGLTVLNLKIEESISA